MGKTATGFSFSTNAEDIIKDVDLANKVYIVTGCNTGIGRETARVLAKQGATVVMACRSPDKAQEAAAAIREQHPDAKLIVDIPLDLASLPSVRDFVDKFAALGLPLHVLINNGAVMACPYATTADGFELQFGTNHLGHYELTRLLLPKLKATAEKESTVGRIVIVSSLAHAFPYKAGILFDNIQQDKVYQPWLAYGQSKLANLLHARQLAKTLSEEGAPVVVNALHPGSIHTDLQRHMGGWLEWLFPKILFFMMKTIPQGAGTQVYLAAHPDGVKYNGEYFVDVNPAKSSKMGQDLALAAKLDELSVKLIANPPGSAN